METDENEGFPVLTSTHSQLLLKFHESEETEESVKFTRGNQVGCKVLKWLLWKTGSECFLDSANDESGSIRTED